MTENPQNIGNQELSETIKFNERSIKSGCLKIEVEGYPLKEDDFDTLVQPGAGFFEWSRRVLLITIGSSIILVAKIIQFISEFNAAIDKNIVSLKIEKFEWIAISIALVLCLLLFLGGLCFKNRKEKLIKKIKQHFKSAKNG